MVPLTTLLVGLALAAAMVAYRIFRVWLDSRPEDRRFAGPCVVPPGPVLRLRADFNGLFGHLLCLSHDDFSLDDSGNKVWLRPGMIVQAWDEDGEDGARDDILALGVVERAPAGLRHNGSKWVLWIDARGACHESELRDAAGEAPSDAATPPSSDASGSA